MQEQSTCKQGHGKEQEGKRACKWGSGPVACGYVCGYVCSYVWAGCLRLCVASLSLWVNTGELCRAHLSMRASNVLMASS